MPAVFVHGVPDTHRVWEPLLEQLDEGDAVTLSMPGFGCPLPEGFDASKESYVDWLLAELRGVEGPIDLVAHDWGALLALRALSLDPGVARSWVAGGAAVDPEYVWHDVAQTWQTPGVGEQMMAMMVGPALYGALVNAGVPAANADTTVAYVDDTMKGCVLALYRSAVYVGHQWAPDLERIDAPGLVLWGEKDPYATPRFGQRLAARTGARFVELAGCGHWWQLERPAEVAAEIRAHWTSLGR